MNSGKEKKELNIKNYALKKTKNVHEMRKKEYQNLYNEHTVLKKKLQQYEEYYRSQQIQKKKRKEKKGRNLKKKRGRLKVINVKKGRIFGLR